jgi:hypothetical protein
MGEDNRPHEDITSLFMGEDYKLHEGQPCDVTSLFMGEDYKLHEGQHGDITSLAFM